MISDKRVLDFTKKMIIIGDIALFMIVVIFIYLVLFTGGQNSIRVYNLDSDSKKNIDVVELYSDELVDGKEIVLEEEKRVWVHLDDKYYTFQLSEIFTENKKVSLHIENIPFDILFEEDQKRSFDLNSNGYYDVEVYLKKVSSIDAIFLFKETNEKVSSSDSVAFWLDYFRGKTKTSLDGSKYILYVFYIILVIGFILVLYLLIPLIKKYSRLKNLKARKNYLYVMKYLIKQFNENKRYDKDKALRIYERIEFVYGNLNPKDKKKYTRVFEKIKKKVSSWKNI